MDVTDTDPDTVFFFSVAYQLAAVLEKNLHYEVYEKDQVGLVQYIYIYTYICMYLCMYVSIYIYIYLSIYLSIYLYVYIYVHL